MKILQTIIYKLACLGLLAAGAALVVFPISDLYGLAVSKFPHPNPIVRIIVGIVVAAVGCFALLPLGGKRRKSRELVFKGADGTETICFDALTPLISKAISRLSIVKKVNLKAEINKSGDKLDYEAEVSIIKPEDAGLRLTTSQMKEYLRSKVEQELGADLVGQVSVRVHPVGSESVRGKEAVVLPAHEAEPEEPAIEEEASLEDSLPRPEAAEPAPPDSVAYEETARLAQEEGEALAGAANTPHDPVVLEPEDEDDEEIPEVELDQSDAGDKAESEARAVGTGDDGFAPPMGSAESTAFDNLEGREPGGEEPAESGPEREERAPGSL